ncbi:hypothetical protein RB195_021311 [Necator americanus]|uniref:Peptidase family M1 n=1 Tax=Necator americanus TaxID=51031 RepID=A0ABR1EAR3_NECAM
MDRLRAVVMVAVLLLTVFSLGCYAAGPHPIIVPDQLRHVASERDGSFRYNSSLRLPDVVSVMEYFVQIQPYYPAPEVHYNDSRNMTFDGFVLMSMVVKKPTNVITLNALNIDVSDLHLKDLLQNEIRVKERKYNNVTQRLIIHLTDELPAGLVLTLSINYTGLINPYTDGGLFYTYYLDTDGEVHWMIATQMEAFGARSVFPCFDEPAFKAVFRLQLIFPSSHVPLGNTMRNKGVELENGWSMATFPPTPIMSTYLVAFTVGPFESHTVINKDGILVRSWGWTGQREYLKFAAETAAECLHQMTLYTGVKFPINKCDNVGLPQFPSGAMENYGLLLYKYQLIPFNPYTTSVLQKIESARVLCHEVSHQWFGDLVTAKWWDNLFLHEGFAAYFMRLMMGKVFPEEAKFVDTTMLSLDREQALNQDAGPTTHPLIASDGPYFDKITYKKGSALLRMLSDVLGQEVFQDGIREYIKSHEYGTASHLDLYTSLTEAAARAKVKGCCSYNINVTDLMEPFSHQEGFPLINVHYDKFFYELSQEPYNETSDSPPSPWNYTWIIPVRTESFELPEGEVHWMMSRSKRVKVYSLNNEKHNYRLVSYTSATYGRVRYDNESLNAILEKITTEDVPIGVKITLVGDEVALIKRQISRGLPYSYDRLLNVLSTVYNTPSTDDPSFTLADLVLPQMEFFASLMQDSIDAPLIDRFFNKVFGKIYKPELWESADSWNANAFKYAFLPYAVKYNIGDAVQRAKKVFKEIDVNCAALQSNNGSSWCSGVSVEIHRAAYCAAGKYDNERGENYDKLMNYYSGEVKVNPYFFQEYRALLEGMACTELPGRLETLIELFLESPLQPSMIFGWFKSNPKASDALYGYLDRKSDSVLKYDGLSSYFDAMTYNWRSKTRLQQFTKLHQKLLQKLNKEQKALFDKYEEKIKKNIEWSEQHLPSIMRWMYDKLVVVRKLLWKKRLPGTIAPKQYDLEITPYIPGSGKYIYSKNMTFDGKVTVKFIATEETSEIVLNAHRLVIDPDSIVVMDNQNKTIKVITTRVTKDYDNGILHIPVGEKLRRNSQYYMTISYYGFIFDKPQDGVLSNYNYYEFNGKQGWIFSTDFEGGPSPRSLLVCCDEPAYKAAFKITVRHPADMTALSNMINTDTTMGKDGWAVTSFQKTPPMSSYLVAISVGHFSSLSAVSETGVLVRVFSWTGMEKYAEFSVKVMAASVDYMSNYFNSPYPLNKLDIIALPQYTGTMSAMENWGLIIGNYKLLMIDPEYASAAVVGKVSTVVAHEVAHQWFGDLVTMDWWSNLFLNEGFAEYWSLNAVNDTFTDQRAYSEYFRFIATTKALWDDCGETPFPILTDESGLFTSAVYKKGSALLNTLSHTLSPETLQKGLRSYVSKKAYGNAKPADLWAALTEASAEDGVKGWDGRNLDVSTFMDSWTNEGSYPILKLKYDMDNSRVTYEQESCSGGSASNTTWYIPVVSKTWDKSFQYSEELNWFHGKDGSSQKWSQIYPMKRIDNIRRTSFLRTYYDNANWASLLKNVYVVKDSTTLGAILDDAWFFLMKGSYTWTQFLDLTREIMWKNDLIPWTVGLQFMRKMYEAYRFHADNRRILKYLIYMGESSYLTIHEAMKPSPYWDQQILGGELAEWMCRLNNSECLKRVNIQFNNFVSKCSTSRTGTAQCVGVIPDYRATMYCYGLRQNPKAHDLIYSLQKYFARNAFYFNRDRLNLLYGLSCLNDFGLQKNYIHRVLDGLLPAEFILYIGENDVTGNMLYDFFVEEIRKILNSDIGFDFYVEAMITDWSRKDQIQKLINFKFEEDYKFLNKEQRDVWEDAIKTVVERESWIGSKKRESRQTACRYKTFYFVRTT